MKKIKYFSAFSGIGGFELGLENAAKSAGLAVECVGHSEIDTEESKKPAWETDNRIEIEIVNPPEDWTDI